MSLPAVHEKRLLFLPEDTPPPLLRALVGVESLRGGFAAPYTEDNCALTHLVYPAVPSPMELDDSYDWPGRYVPMRHQVVTAGWMALHERLYVFNDPGTGKTLSAIFAIDWLLRAGRIKRVLVAAPISVQLEWANELFGACPTLRFTNLLGPKARKLSLLNADSQIDIINHDGLHVMQKELVARKYDLVIIDECTRGFKSPKTHASEAVGALTSNGQRLVLMSGTPLASSVADAFGLLRLVYPRMSCVTTKAEFQRQFMVQVKRFKWVGQVTATERLFGLMRPAVRYSADACLDLPDMVTRKYHPPMTETQSAAVADMRIDAVHKHPDGVITGSTAAAKVSKVLQILQGAVRTTRDSDEADAQEQIVLALDCEPRLTCLLEIIEEAREQAIVFVPNVAPLHAVSDFLTKKNVKHGKLWGAVSGTERQKIITAFKRGDTTCLLAQPATASHGLNLANAKHVIWYAPIYDYEVYYQANKRVHRKGQTSRTFVHHIGSHPIEWRIYSLLGDKKEVQGEFLKLYELIFSTES